MQFEINHSFYQKIKLIKDKAKLYYTSSRQHINLASDNKIIDCIVDDIIKFSSNLDGNTAKLQNDLYVKIRDIFGDSWSNINEQLKIRTITNLHAMILEKYIEPKPEYGKCFSRVYADYLTLDWFDEMIKINNDKDILQASKSIVRVFMDMNGLGKLNNIGKPFHTISLAIGMFVDLLKSCKTVELIRSMGLKYNIIVEGGDEFSIIIFDPEFKIDVFSMMPEIKYSFILEMENVRINKILDKKKLNSYFGDTDVNIHLSSSFGYQSFWQIVNDFTVEEINECNPNNILNLITTRWFDRTYSDANVFKNQYKLKKIEQNPKLYNFLYVK